MSNIIHADEKGRVEVDYRHNYNANCRCMACLQLFLTIEDGFAQVMSRDGNAQLTYPKRGTIWCAK